MSRKTREEQTRTHVGLKSPDDGEDRESSGTAERPPERKGRAGRDGGDATARGDARGQPNRGR